MTARPNELTAVEAARRIEAGDLTVEALLRACLDRIEEREPEIAAFAHLDREQLLATAIAHDGAGPMRGVPVGVKDIVDTVDAPTTYGSPIYRDHWPGADAVCVNRIHAAGGIVLGKTVTTEFAARYPGPTATPTTSAIPPAVHRAARLPRSRTAWRRSASGPRPRAR